MTDQNDHKKTTHKDVRDNTVAVIEPGDITTTYEYSTMNEITKVTDADGKMTTMKYDGFGRRTEINNPDTGRTLFAYDTAGNMTRKITAELNAKGKAIKYRYDHNRLVQVDYPETEDVYYTYGAAGSANNRAGRVYRVDNGTVAEELYFGRLGETIKSVKTIDDSGVKTTYTTKYEFDNMGRMRRLVYPDGEILTYSYGHGGLLKGAIGETKTGKRVYLENILYDEFGQRTSVKYGNGTESTYTYEPEMRRLTNLKTTSSEGKVLQNIEYEYDDVGNITNRKNSGFNTTDEIERNSEQSYTYDDLDRLETSKGTFDHETWNPFFNKRVNSYKSFFSYNQTGKILQKTQTNTGLLTETNETVTIDETTYDWSYEYTGPHPNAVTKAGPRTFSYDLNGNMTTMVDTSKSVTRSLIWDEENRLKQTKDVSTAAGATAENITTYGYDAGGTRALKKGKYGTVEYVSDNYTVRNKDLISKHVYAGNTVSRVIMNEEKSGTMVATEQGSYYYHADHLGSSSVVTDSSGKFYEQIEYFPYGETWIHNKANTEQTSTPYKFTSKELDEETGLYYYGARYYDARLSRWVSADPPLARGDYFPVPPINDKAKEKNSKLPGNGGIFNSINLDAYHYAGQNPVKLIDPDGNQMIPWDRETLAVFDLMDGMIGRSDGSYFAEGSGINSGRAFGEGFVYGYVDSAVGFNVSKFIDRTRNSEEHDIEYSFGYNVGKYAGYSMTAATIANGLYNVAGRKFTSVFVENSIKDIMKDPRRLKDFGIGVKAGIMPEFNPSNLENFDQLLGYFLAKTAVIIIPEFCKEKNAAKKNN